MAQDRVLVRENFPPAEIGGSGTCGNGCGQRRPARLSRFLPTGRNSDKCKSDFSRKDRGLPARMVSEAARERLLEAAGEVFSEVGFDAATNTGNHETGPGESCRCELLFPGQGGAVFHCVDAGAARRARYGVVSRFGRRAPAGIYSRDAEASAGSAPAGMAQPVAGP